MRRPPHTRIVAGVFASATLVLLASCNRAAQSGGRAESATSTPATRPTDTRPAVPETILLHSRDAAVHGKTLRYEPQPQKNTLGYWTDAADWASWDFTV